MLSLHFLRHGQTEFSRENAYCGAGTDAPLTEDGLAMAAAFARAYSAKDFIAIYSSPMIRARQTIAPFAAAAGIEPQYRGGLKEVDYGLWEGKSRPEVEKLYPEAQARWIADPVLYGTSGGETVVDVWARTLKVIEEIKATVKDGPVLIVSHKATIRVAICNLIGLDPHLFRIAIDCPTGSLSTVEMRHSGPMLTRMADRSHFDERLLHLPGT